MKSVELQLDCARNGISQGPVGHYCELIWVLARRCATWPAALTAALLNWEDPLTKSFLREKPKRDYREEC